MQTVYVICTFTTASRRRTGGTPDGLCDAVCFNLESLAVSLGELEYFSIVDGRVLLLPRLRHLQLNGNDDVASRIAERLSSLDAPLDLTHLDLSGNKAIHHSRTVLPHSKTTVTVC